MKTHTTLKKWMMTYDWDDTAGKFDKTLKNLFSKQKSKFESDMQ